MRCVECGSYNILTTDDTGYCYNCGYTFKPEKRITIDEILDKLGYSGESWRRIIKKGKLIDYRIQFGKTAMHTYLEFMIGDTTIKSNKEQAEILREEAKRFEKLGVKIDSVRGRYFKERL